MYGPPPCCKRKNESDMSVCANVYGLCWSTMLLAMVECAAPDVAPQAETLTYSQPLPAFNKPERPLRLVRLGCIALSPVADSTRRGLPAVCRRLIGREARAENPHQS